MPENNIDRRLELVRTGKATYLGYVEEDEHYIHMSKAAVIPEGDLPAAQIAFEYFSEKARRNLSDRDIPRTAVEMKTYEPQVEAMLRAYDELYKVAQRGSYGRAKIARLKKFLQNPGGGK